MAPVQRQPARTAVWFRRCPYSTHFQQYAVHPAELVGAALRAAIVFVPAARLAAPLAIHDELKFIMSGRKRQRGSPMPIRLSRQRRCLGTPIIEGAGPEHGLRLVRVAVNSTGLFSCLASVRVAARMHAIHAASHWRRERQMRAARNR